MPNQKYDIVTINNYTFSGKPFVEGKAILVDKICTLTDLEQWRVRFYEKDGNLGEEEFIRLIPIKQ